MIDTYGTVLTDPADIRADGHPIMAMPEPAADDEIMAMPEPAADDEIMAVLAEAPRDTAPDRPACAGMDPSIFFPEVGETADEARAVCATCPARPHEACLTFAFEHHERHGVWAGLTEEDRRPLLRLLAIPRPVPERCGNDLHDRTEANTSRQRGANGGYRCKPCDRAAHTARRQARAEQEAA